MRDIRVVACLASQQARATWTTVRSCGKVVREQRSFVDKKILNYGLMGERVQAMILVVGENKKNVRLCCRCGENKRR